MARDSAGATFTARAPTHAPKDTINEILALNGPFKGISTSSTGAFGAGELICRKTQKTRRLMGFPTVSFSDVVRVVTARFDPSYSHTGHGLGVVHPWSNMS